MSNAQICSHSSWLVKLAFILFLGLIAGSLFFTIHRGIETNLHTLVGGEKGSRMASVADAMQSEARFLVHAPTRVAAEKYLATIPGVLDSNRRDGQRSTSFLAPFAGGLLSASTREQLQRDDFAAVRANALARLYSPTPPIVPIARDPFLLLTEYVMHFVPKDPAWHLFTYSLSPAQAERTLAWLDLNQPQDLHISGAPFHTAATANRAKLEINVLGVLSLLGVLGVGIWLFRNIRFVPLLLFSLVAAFTVGTAMVFALFPRPHMLTFVFGTTLAGIGVDYVYHVLSAQRDIRHQLTSALLSTSACFVPLLFSELTVLCQMAVFTLAGIISIYATALILGLKGAAVKETTTGEVKQISEVDVRVLSPRIKIVLYLLFAIYVAMGILRVRMVNGPEAFYRPNSFLAAEEKFVAEMLGTTSFLPPVAIQRENAALVRKLYAAVGADYCAETGLPISVLTPPNDNCFFEPREELGKLFARYAQESYRLLGCSFGLLALAAWICFRRNFIGYAVHAIVANLLTLATLGWIGMKISFFHALCFFVFTGLGADYAIFLLRGGVGNSTMRRTVFASLLTSVCAFALLAFTDFPVTHGMGVTLFMGLIFSYLTARFFSRWTIFGRQIPKPSLRRINSGTTTPWYEQPERGAGRLRMQFMWFLYRFSGKTLPKLVACVVVACVFPWVMNVRKVLYEFYAMLGITVSHWQIYKHMVGFAWGLVDKIDACTLSLHPPRMTVRTNDAWQKMEAYLHSGKGVVLLTTHLGTAEVLPAFTKKYKAHAFQQLSHNSEFTRVLLKHLDSTRLVLHDVAAVDIAMVEELKMALSHGEIVLMAGDRVGKSHTRATNRFIRPFLGRKVVWPRGVFRLAEILEAPIFAVTCVSVGWNTYDIHVEPLLDPFPDYVAFLENETRLYPDQWYHFYNFWQDAPE